MIGRWIIGIIGAITLAYGVAGFAFPADLGESLGVGAHSALGLSELRALYGGVLGTLGIVLLAALRFPGGGHWTRVVAAIHAGAAISRVTSVALGGMDGAIIFAACYETIVALALFKASSSLD